MPKVRCHRNTNYTLELSLDGEDVELEIDNPPGSIMDYVDYHVERPDANTLIVAYLVDDDNVQNPLDDCDGVGMVYSGRRNGVMADHRRMQEALGLDRDWDARWPEFESDARQALQAESGADHDEVDIPDAAVKAKAKELWRATLNPHAVLLDVYSHGGERWSVAGHGMQCQWDTSRNAGVWVPDEACKDHIETFPEADRRRRAVECAKQALSSYNAWLAGECYGIVTCLYRKIGDCWAKIEDDACWGFVGYEGVEELLDEYAGYLRPPKNNKQVQL